MLNLKSFEFWFVTGSQHLYGPETLEQVEAHSRKMAEGLDLDPSIPCKVVFKPVLTTPDAIRKLCSEANLDDKCAGIITWMHTFSPAKMWIAGLSELKKPLLHLHTQFNRDIPWSSIDMDFMNLNQSAHGDREYGFIGARLRIARKVIVGYWENPETRNRIGAWMRSALAFTQGRNLKVARFGDNMRNVAVTEGDKVEAQIKFGWAIDAYGIGDLVERIDSVTEAQVNELMDEYKELYDIDPAANIDSIKEQARIEIGMKSFLEEGNFGAFTTNFENLFGMKQLPGLAVQRLMAQGYGFGGEGDWKTAAMVRIMKLMSAGLSGGTSFMEDYTYHLEPGNEMILGAHMLEVCPTIAATKPRIEVHPLSIGGKADPARLVFNGKGGSAIATSLIEMGGRYRLIINTVNAVQPTIDMPKLPVARVLWKPEPSLSEAAEAWILAGGAHHTSFSYDVTVEQMMDWAEMAQIECVLIDKNTDILAFRNQLKWNDMAWRR
ncbi:L-arabinose isomerase [Defluviitalea raffinosedens]|jgi:L-arabinose isomerase|uniref:L-arabinose isomerase n=1 Tax=Defluviitalea raffinosedens TaxID=1450156 RepID=A0A7C8HCZ8_9FIRM|nr:L-arabinose isomerase [Defluviitalea raffinosedens]KAE9628733.1 L-arabinose isomerase [Defluviitalea raffinosedens]MBM7686866.1 L-arabinose isomerase [Defluviitalea raffinosedens]HHW66610.1 L-arabinose isomerase [Candidatus Epulonipiscium sp.]